VPAGSGDSTLRCELGDSG